MKKIKLRVLILAGVPLKYERHFCRDVAEPMC